MVTLSEKDTEEEEPEEQSVIGTDLGSSSSSESQEDLPTRNRLLPWRPFPRNCLFYTHPDTWELVDHFEHLVHARDIAEKGKTRKISANRYRTWVQAANDLLDDYPVALVKQVCDTVFDRWFGYLPFPVLNLYTGRYENKDRRVTRLGQILYHFTLLMDVLDEPDIPDPPITKSKPKAYYDHGEGFAMEDQVTELVETFTKTKTILGRQVSDFDLFAWRKTFRIMLGHRQIPFADIKLVVDALAERRLELDYGRYSAPYDLIRTPREWENVLASVQIAQKRYEMRPKPPPRPSHFDDDDYHYYRYRDPHGDDDTGQSVDMSTNVEERFRRYMARAVR